MGTGEDKEEVSGVSAVDHGEAHSSLREPSSHHDDDILTPSSRAVNAMENDGGSSLGHENSSLQDKEDGQGDADDEDGMSSSRLYGYEDPDQSMQNGRPNPAERQIRRHVVTAETARYEISYHPGRVHLYAPPRQRQKWGETQVLPRINWGDLFCDLFYVAAAYNISNILAYDASPLGYLYAAGTFFPILHIWVEHTIFASKYVHDSDVTHSILRILALVVIATAVLNIRPVDIMSHSSTEISMFVFCLCLGLKQCITLLRYVELYCFGVGQTKVIQRESLSHGCKALILLVFYIAATIVAAMDFFPRHAEQEYHRFLAEAVAAEEKNEYQDAASEDSTTHIPIILCLVGIIANSLSHVITVIFFFPSGGRHKQCVVPMNVEFNIHRNGEWISLMFGESIFSLLIVNVPSEDRAFFTTFYFGILTVMLLHYLHFQSQPHDPEDHASRRNKNAGVIWAQINNIYSFALVCLGAAYTYFLTDFEDSDIGEARRLGGGGGGSTSELDDDALRLNASILFSAALAFIFLCLDIMNLLHLGIQESRDRVMSRKQISYKGIVFVFLRMFLTVFAATLWMWDNNPKELSVIGFCCVLAQLSLRKIGSKYMSHQQCHVLDPAYISTRRPSQFGEQSSSAAAEPQ